MSVTEFEGVPGEQAWKGPSGVNMWRIRYDKGRKTAITDVPASSLYAAIDAVKALAGPEITITGQKNLGMNPVFDLDKHNMYLEALERLSKPAAKVVKAADDVEEWLKKKEKEVMHGDEVAAHAKRARRKA